MFNMNTAKDMIMKLVDEIPETKAGEIIDFLLYLKTKEEQVLYLDKIEEEELEELIKTDERIPSEKVMELKVNDIVNQYINDVQRHIKVNKAVLYGSYAKGNFDEQSDVDLAIFSESFTGKNLIEMNSFLFSLARKYMEVCIEPIGFNYTDLFDDNPFVKEILNTGKEIYHQ